MMCVISAIRAAIQPFTIIIIKTLYRHQIYLGRGVRPVSL
jgi:hypothetical protein